MNHQQTKDAEVDEDEEDAAADDDDEEEKGQPLSYFHHLVDTREGDDDPSYSHLKKLSAALITRIQEVCHGFMTKINASIVTCPSELKRVLQKSVQVGPTVYHACIVVYTCLSY